LFVTEASLPPFGGLTVVAALPRQIVQRPGQPRGSTMWTVAEAALRLSARKLEVLSLVAQGLTAKEVGARLGISRRTVESHKYAALAALGLSSTAALIGWIYRNAAGAIPGEAADA
jgi:DNA-binding NarL/FixJ family response regulator